MVDTRDLDPLFEIIIGSMRKQYTKDDVIKAVADSKSIADVLRQLGLRPVGGNYKTIHKGDDNLPAMLTITAQ